MSELKDYQQQVNKNALLVKHKFLSFTLGNVEYAIDILNVQEIQSFQSVKNINKISNAPAHIKGIILCQDVIVPLVDLRLFYNLPITDQNEFNVIILIKYQQKMLGMIVDAVSDILDIHETEIKPAPDLFSFIDQDFIKGIASIDDHLVIILDIQKLIFSKPLQIARYMEENIK